ncbi:MAG: helix-turn-helix transcriptional regulator [Mollicutes bacterium]|nr:helix-turn-helix transcriptional regulator [Mollicutes bacterium]
MKRPKDDMYNEYLKINKNSSLGEFLLNLRKNINLTQLKLSELLNVSYKTISKWENNVNYPDASLYKKICEVFDITIEEYFNCKINIVERKQKDRMYKRKILNILFALILFPALSFFMLSYFIHINYFKLYNIQYFYNDYGISVSGVCVSHVDEASLYISNIKTYDFQVLKTDIVNISYYYKDKLFFHSSSFEDIKIKSEFIKKCDINNIKIKIEVIRGDKVVYQTGFKLVKTNNSNKKNKKNQFLDNKKVKEILLSQSYIYDKKKDAFVKKIKKKNVKITIMYMLDLGKLVYLEENENYAKNIVYIKNSDFFEALIYLYDNKTRILKEKYNYSYINEEFTCYTKICTTKEDILRLMNNYVTLLKRE